MPYEKGKNPRMKNEENGALPASMGRDREGGASTERIHGEPTDLERDKHSGAGAMATGG